MLHCFLAAPSASRADAHLRTVFRISEVPAGARVPAQPLYLLRAQGRAGSKAEPFEDPGSVLVSKSTQQREKASAKEYDLLSAMTLVEL